MEPKPQEILDTGYDKDETQQQRLITVLNELEDEVEKQNSIGRMFAKGVVHGLGTVIGATVLLAVLASSLAVIIDTLGIGNIPVLSDFVKDVLEGR